jgi:hypothetical protein
MTEEIRQTTERTMDIKHEDRWEKVLIRDEFWNLYLGNLGLSDCLLVDRKTSLLDIKQDNHEKFRFAIVRNKILSEGTESRNKVVSAKSINAMFMFPEEPEIYDDSINFLSLAISGFLNLDKDLPIFTAHDKDNIPKQTLLEFISRVEEQEPEIKFNSDRLDSFFKNDEEFLKEHNTYAKSIFEDRLDKIDCSEKENIHYSLFFMKNSNLYEFRTQTKKIYEVAFSLSETKIHDTIAEYLTSHNDRKDKAHEFLNDITFFSESNKEEDHENISSNIGEILAILLFSLLFIFNFLIAFPESKFSRMKETFVDFFEKDAEDNSIVDQLNNFNEVQAYFYFYITRGLYDEVQNKFNYTLTLTAAMMSEASTVKINSTTPSNFTDFVMPGNRYYLMNSNFFCGMMVNFRHSLMRNEKDLNGANVEARQITLDYYSSIPVQQTESFLSFDVKSLNPLYPGSYELYLKPTLNINQLFMYKNQLDPFFGKELYEFSFTVLLYNSDDKLLALYSLNFYLDAYGKINYQRTFLGVLPFINSDNNIFMKLLIMNILFIILLIYFAFTVIRTFSNYLIELIVNQNYNFEWYDWVDFMVLVLCCVTQIFFYKTFLFSSDIFPIQVTNEESFVVWTQNILDARNFQRVAGVRKILFKPNFLVMYVFNEYKIQQIFIHYLP